MTVYVPSSPGITGQALVTPTPQFATGTSVQYLASSLPGGYVVQDGASGNGIMMIEGIENAGTSAVGIQAIGSNPNFYLHTTGQQVHLIDSGGYVFSASGKAVVFGQATPDVVTGLSGTAIQINPVSTPPTAGPPAANGGYLYVASGGALHWRGPTTDTAIAPA